MDLVRVIEKSETSHTEALFARARSEAERYGDDPWVFLRELVQNSRDAHAHSIEIGVAVDDLSETITCRDDGRGMSSDDAADYLLRLYASSKGEDGSIGFFGVGFWSVLRFEPSTIRVISRGPRDALGLEIDCQDLRIASIPVSATERGTTVEITRTRGTGPQAADGLHSAVRERLVYYAAHVRPYSGEAGIQLMLDGERLDCDFPVPPYGGKRIRGPGFDAVVGFGDTPSVRVYAAGILVRDLVALDEVLPSQGVAAPRGGWGVYPVVRINAEGFRLLLDRQTLFEDQTLRRAVRQCERALISGHSRLVQGFLPMDPRNRVMWLFAGMRRHRIVIALSLLAGALTFALLTAIGEGAMRPLEVFGVPSRGVVHGASSSRVQTIDSVARAFLRPAHAHEEANGSLSWDFSYSGPPRVLFVVRYLTEYDPVLGFRAEPATPADVYPDFPDSGGEHTTVTLGVTGYPGYFTLPLPPGHVVVSRSLRYEDEPSLLWQGMWGEPLMVASQPGLVSYTTVARRVPTHCTTSLLAPAIRWTNPFANALKRLPPGNVEAQIETLTVPLREGFTYVQGCDSPPSGRPWIERALEEGSGDCDEINGILTLLLRSAGIDAHLAVAVVGDRGAATPLLHAVTAYCHDGWRIVDATAVVEANPAAGTGSVPADRPSAGSPVRYRVSLPAAFLPWFGVIALATAAGWALVVERRVRRRHPDPRHVRYLFDHLCGRGPEGVGDLMFRPVVPVLGGRRRSLHEMYRLSSRGAVVGAFPTAVLVPHLRSQPIIDRSEEAVDLLEPYLPPVTWLDDWAMLVEPAVLPRGLEAVQRVIQAVDPGFRLRVVPGSAGPRWAFIPLTHGFGDRHVVIGLEHPLCSRFSVLADTGPTGVLRAAELLVEAVPLYLSGHERMLDALRHEGRRRGA